MWDDLRFFLAVAREGSLSGAARELGVNHATVLRRLRGLEERLGSSLFERRSDGYVLTPAGADIMENAERIEVEALAVERRVTGMDVRLTGTVRITTVDSLAERFLVPGLTSFAAVYPGIELELVTSDLHANLSRREADIALRPSNNPGDTMVGRRVGKITFGLYAFQSGVWDDWQPGLPLPEDGMVIRGEGTLAALASDRWFASQIPDVGIALSSNSFLTHYQACCAGVGIACLPDYLKKGGDGLKKLASAPTETNTDIWLLTPPELRKTARIRAVLDWVTDQIAK